MNRIGMWLSVLMLVCVSTPSTADSHEPSVEGAWTLTVDTPRGARHPVLVIVRKGDHYSGMLRGERGARAIEEIQVEGDKFSFAMHVPSPMGELELTYQGAVEGDSMAGTIGNPMGSVVFTGKRKPAAP